MLNNLDFFNHLISLKETAITSSADEVNLVYHYTSIDTFDKIITKQSLRFTDYRYLNDTQEFVWGLKQIKNVLEKIKGKNAKLILDNLHMFGTVELYVASFCSEPDKLSQWRAYGNNGKGVSFGIKPKEMVNACGLIFFSGNVIYDNKKQTKRIRKVIRESISYFQQKQLSIDDVASVIRYLSLIIATYKHKSFSEESEYRFFIISNSKQRPYWIEKDISSDAQRSFFLLNTIESIKNMDVKELFPIEEVYIGPSCNHYTSEIFLQKLLNRNKYEQSTVKIINSEIPYRC